MELDSDTELQQSQSQRQPKSQRNHDENGHNEEEMELDFYENRDRDGGYDADQKIEEKREVRAAFRDLNDRFKGKCNKWLVCCRRRVKMENDVFFMIGC